MGMHEPGWRERNAELAWETWRIEALAEIAKIRAATELLQQKISQNDADNFGPPLAAIDDACEALWARRHGPENPSHA